MANIFEINRQSNKITLGTADTTIKITPLTAGRIPFIGAGSLISDDASLIWDNTNKRMGIGIAVPPRKVTIVENDADAIFIRHTDGADASTLGLGVNTTTGFAYIQSRDDSNGVTQPLTFWVGNNKIVTIGIDQSTKIGDGGTTNYTQFSAVGFQTLVGDARYEQEQFITAISLAPGSTGPDAVILGNSIGYSYDIGDDSVFNFEIPYGWDSSTDITLEIYWYINEARTGSNEEVQWRIQWSACPVGSTEAIDAPTHTGTIDFDDQLIPTVAKALTEISGTISAASLTAGDFISCTIDRVALDGGNNPSADPVIVQIEVETVRNTHGKAV